MTPVPNRPTSRFQLIGTASGAVPITAYVAAWRRVKAAPPGSEFSYSLEGLTPASRDEILGQFLSGIHERINRHISGFGMGRKWSPDWERGAILAAVQVNTPRLAVHWVPFDLRGRLAHRLSDDAA